MACSQSLQDWYPWPDPDLSAMEWKKEVGPRANPCLNGWESRPDQISVLDTENDCSHDGYLRLWPSDFLRVKNTHKFYTYKSDTTSLFFNNGMQKIHELQAKNGGKVLKIVRHAIFHAWFKIFAVCNFFTQQTYAYFQCVKSRIVVSPGTSNLSTNWSSNIDSKIRMVEAFWAFNWS